MEFLELAINFLFYLTESWIFIVVYPSVRIQFFKFISPSLSALL